MQLRRRSRRFRFLVVSETRVMPRYYINLHDGEMRPDREGSELPHNHAAWSEAVRTCGEMLKNIDGDLPVNSKWEMEVSDEHGRTIFTLRFSANENKAN